MKSDITIGLIGDIMLGRLVNEQINRYGYKYPWGNILPLLKKNDFNFGNLETTLTNSTDKTPKVFNFKATPDKAETLRLANIDAVSLANNHILDFGYEGLFETLSTLQDNNIKYTGAGENISKAQEPIILEKDNLRVGIIGATDNVPEWIAGHVKPGINYIEINKNGLEILKKQIDRLTEQVDIIIVSLHWGPNMRQSPTEEFQKFARALIGLGVDIVHGHSAHIFQDIEVFQDGLILYDTGDFIDDYRVDPKLRNDHSFLFNVRLNKNKVKELELIPVKIDHMQVNVAEEKEREEILEKMKKLSSNFDTQFVNNKIIL